MYPGFSGRVQHIYIQKFCPRYIKIILKLWIKSFSTKFISTNKISIRWLFFYIYINLSSYYDEISLLIIHLIYTYNLFYIGNTINIILKKLNLHKLSGFNRVFLLVLFVLLATCTMVNNYRQCTRKNKF